MKDVDTRQVILGVTSERIFERAEELGITMNIKRYVKVKRLIRKQMTGMIDRVVDEAIKESANEETD